MPNVHIAVTGEGPIHRSLFSSLMRILAEAKSSGQYGFTIGTRSENNTPKEIIRKFLQDDQDFLLLVEPNVHPVLAANPLKLLDENLDIVGCPTPVWCGENTKRRQWFVAFNAYKRAEGSWQFSDQGGGDITEVDAVGRGCLLIARRVLATLPHLSGEITSEPESELAFCWEAKKAGFRVWCAWEHPCERHEERGLLEVHHAVGRLVTRGEVEYTPKEINGREDSR